jgi:hypothetical protein
MHFLGPSSGGSDAARIERLFRVAADAIAQHSDCALFSASLELRGSDRSADRALKA